MLQQHIDEIFDPQKFTKEDITFHTEKYKQVKRIAQDIDAYLPDSEAKTLIFNTFKLALMHLGHAIGRKNYNGLEQN